MLYFPQDQQLRDNGWWGRGGGSLRVYVIHLQSFTNARLLSEIIIKQKQAIRIITKYNYNSNKELLLKNSKILPVSLLADSFKLKFRQHCYQKFLPQKVQRNCLKKLERHRAEEEDILSYQTRNFDEFLAPFSRLASIDKLPLIIFPRLWNSFHNSEIKVICNKLKFKLKLNKHFLDRLLYQACHPIR
jgi:hypothetical protein